MAALPNLITVEQFREIPESGEFTYELHHGEVVSMTRPKTGHWHIQIRLMHRLTELLPGYMVGIEFPFRAVPQFDLRAADVAAITRERYAASDLEDNLRGAPDLVIEVKSPSNTARQLQELASLCLANGAIEFWIVDRKQKLVTVVQRDGSRETHGLEAQISLAAFGGGSLEVADVF